jgi:hypothetical protein
MRYVFHGLLMLLLCVGSGAAGFYYGTKYGVERTKQWILNHSPNRTNPHYRVIK